jgi:hypothetical protein
VVKFIEACSGSKISLRSFTPLEPKANSPSEGLPFQFVLLSMFLSAFSQFTATQTASSIVSKTDPYGSFIDGVPSFAPRGLYQTPEIRISVMI